MGDKQDTIRKTFLSSLSACHMLLVFAFVSIHNITVIEYSDNATGIIEETENGSGKFTEVTLNPKVKITDESSIEKETKITQRSK